MSPPTQSRSRKRSDPPNHSAQVPHTPQTPQTPHTPPQRWFPSYQQLQQYHSPAYLRPTVRHDFDLSRHTINSPHRSFFVDPMSQLALVNQQTSPSSYRRVPTIAARSTARGDAYSDCCNNDNCVDQCDNAECTDECTNDCPDDCHLETSHCDKDDCKVPSCPVSPCTPAPCIQGTTAVCSAATCEDHDLFGCVDATYCNKDNCDVDCPTIPCPDDCAGNECHENSCTDYPCTDGEGLQHVLHYDGTFDCVSFALDNAHSERWQHHGHTHHSAFPNFPNVAPNNSTMNPHYHPNLHNSFSFNNTPYGSLRSFPPPLDVGYPMPPQKRRKASDSCSIPVSTPAFDHSYSTTPSSAAPTPASSNYGDWLCMWDDDCDESFFDQSALQSHVATVHASDPQRKCLWDGCGQQSVDEASFIDHFKFSHMQSNNVQHPCMWQGCTAIFLSEEELKSHLNSVHVPMAIECKWKACDTTGVDLEAHVHKHVLPHPAEDSAAIKRCEWQDSQADGTVHTCGIVFQTANELQQHAKEVHINALRKKTGYHCYWAGCARQEKPFSQKGKVERHLQTHTGFKSCTCDICGKEFSAPQALQQHVRTHTGEKPYKCDHCGKEFAQGSAMTMHKRTHTGERPLKCDWPGCGKRFSESSNLSKHRKTHNPIGKHVCQFPGCERSFHRLGIPTLACCILEFLWLTVWFRSDEKTSENPWNRFFGSRPCALILADLTSLR
ncbi:hypothetical protein BZA77DRAFT_7232 [Pyronema omphalodes]|nr:hypothetical protein BZA77DRAFT_7232 [Pyronema omphalodes]